MSQVVIRHVEGVTLIGRAKTNHWVAMDGPETFGGADAATRPMELFLISLGGCTGADVASLLQKMRVKVDKFEVHIDSERAPEHPKVYTRIDLTYKFWGKNLESVKDKIEKAINLSQDKYCSISAMLRQANIPLNHTYELIESE